MNTLSLVGGLLSYLETPNIVSASPSPSISPRPEQTKKKLQVLYIFPLERDYLAVSNLPQSILSNYEFHFIDSPHFTYSSKSSKEFSLVQFIDKCRQEIKEKAIDIVLGTRDIADLVQSTLTAENKDQFCGPSILASIATLYKPYTHLWVDEDPIKCSILDLGKDEVSFLCTVHSFFCIVFFVCVRSTCTFLFCILRLPTVQRR